jgi:hypothetical protein
LKKHIKKPRIRLLIALPRRKDRSSKDTSKSNNSR